MKIALGGRFHTKYPIAELGNIQVDGQDPLLLHTVSIPTVSPASSPLRSQLRPSHKTGFRRLLRQR